MSADHENSDSSFRAGYLHSFLSRTKPAESSMEQPTTGCPTQQQLPQSGSESTNMSTLAMMRSPLAMHPSPRDVVWDNRLSREVPSRPRSVAAQPERIELPSIRQAVPEIQQSVRGESDYRSHASTHSPTGRLVNPASPPEYVPSSAMHKRRRPSHEDGEADQRERSVPRLYTSPPGAYRTHSGPISPINAERRLNAVPSVEHWPLSARNSPYISARGVQDTRSPPPFDSSNITNSDWRPVLPSLPSLPLDRGVAPAQQGRANWSEYSLDSSRYRAQTHPQTTAQYEAPSNTYQLPTFGYSHQLPRGQSFSGPSSHQSMTLGRTPFANSSAGYPSGNYPYGHEVPEADSKQRKRRGNLPKETTDKLRTWFVAHLQHPYPTEDEKQELMRQTGLQMNQISNWFINARRRQLPAMINNARVESDARSARGGELLHTDLLAEYGDDGEHHVSDGEGSGYEDDYEGLRRQSHSKGEGG